MALKVMACIVLQSQREADGDVADQHAFLSAAFV